MEISHKISQRIKQSIVVIVIATTYYTSSGTPFDVITYQKDYLPGNTSPLLMNSPVSCPSLSTAISGKDNLLEDRLAYRLESTYG